MNPKDSSRERIKREALFQKRLAELRAENNQFPWMLEATPEFEIPKEESKLFVDRYIEDPTLSDEEVERRALLDLTSYNFWSFYKRLNYEHRRARRYERDLSLLLVAIDAFETIATDHGLTFENQVILSVGRILLGAIRDVDVAGRCRDDTFGVILPETSISGAEIAAERIRTNMEQQVVSAGSKQVLITVSVGGTSSGENDPVDIMVGRAIEALKGCFAEGGNQIDLV